MEECLMSVQDLAQFLGVPKRTIYGWRTQGMGPLGHRIGRHVRYRRQDVDRWLEEQRDPRRVTHSR
jgi:excisionase family DNA binding protein